MTFLYYCAQKGNGGQRVYVLEVGSAKISGLEIYGWIDYNDKSGSILLLNVETALATL